MDGETLVFSGGDPVRRSASPEIYAANLRSGTETLVARASDPNASITVLASVRGNLIFTETTTSGPLIYRVHAVARGVDVTLDELRTDDPTLQQRYRATVVAPMVATDGSVAVWVSGRPTETTGQYTLMAASFDGSNRRVLARSDEWLGYPNIAGSSVLFTRSFKTPATLKAPLDGASPAVLIAEGESEAAGDGERVVSKFGGSGALDPGGIALRTSPGDRKELTPARALASEPSINERYVVWWGPTDRVIAYDWRSDHQVVLGTAPRNPDGKTGLVGRQAAFSGSVVWLESPAGDAAFTANAKPVFNVVFSR